MKALLQKAWSLRMNQQFEEFRLALADLRHQLQIPPGKLSASYLSSFSEFSQREPRIEFYLLLASQARAEGQVAVSKFTLETLESFFSDNGEQAPFQFYFQKGLNLIVETDYSAALEVFLTARLNTTLPHEKIYALTNALFCLDSLGLSLSKTRQELEVLLKTSGIEKELTQSVLSQIRAFDLRIHFREAQFEKIFRTKEAPHTIVDQASYFRLWLSELPFHSFQNSLAAEQSEEFYLSCPYFYQKAYRLRTLQGILHPTDLSGFRETEFADRLYLWTWRWLSNSEKFPIQRIMSLLRDFDLTHLVSRVSAEDFQMVRNSLMWMSLFDPSSLPAIRRVIQSLQPGRAQDYPVFEFESYMLSYFLALRDRRAQEAQDFKKVLMNHPLWKASSVYWPGLIESLEGKSDSKLPLLTRSLRQLLFGSSSVEGKELVINLDTGQITWSKSSVLSSTMAVAFDLLYKKNQVSFDELCFACFGIARFDSVIHNSKVFNLLSRMREIAPSGLKLGTKSGMIYASGDWSGIGFIGLHSSASKLRGQAEWKDLISKKRGPSTADSETERFVKPALVLKKLAGQKELSREELEELTGKSRSTANRLIARWIKQGVLIKTGKAKNTRYIVCSSDKTGGRELHEK